MRMIAQSVALKISVCLIASMLTYPAAAQSQPDGSEVRASDLLAIQLYAVGGGFFTSARSSNVTGVDMTNGAGNFLISSQAGGGSSTTPLLGARIHVPMFWYMHDEQHLGLSVFFETGLQSGLGRTSRTQSFLNTSSMAADFGSNAVREYYQIPLLAGLTVPIGDRSAGPRALLDLYGGFTLDSWSQVLQGVEANAPGQQGFYAENRRFSADPTLGIGVRVPVGSLDAGLPLFFGLNAELQLRPGSVVLANSNNFAVSYYGTLDPYANLAVMARFGIAFGGR